MTTQEYDYDADVSGLGWVTFAAIMMGFAGIWGLIAGIAAISGSRVYTQAGTFVFSNLNTWGWIITILSGLLILAAFAVVSGSQWARWFGILVAAVNAIGQLLFIQAYPFWSLSMFAVDILIIYGLARYAGARLRTA